MSKVALSGNASGTGTFTIASPNSNTDRTLTLPDATGTILTTATAGVPVNGPAFSAYGTGNQSLTNGVFTKVAYNTEQFDTASCYDTSLYRFTPNVAGYYQINAAVIFAQTGTGLLYTRLYKNGVGVIYLQGVGMPPSGSAVVAGSALVYMNGSTDYLEIYMYASTSLTPSGGSSASDFTFSGFLARSAT